MSESNDDGEERTGEERREGAGGGSLDLPNWFRIPWWLLTLAGLLYYLCVRFDDLKAGRAAPADVVVFLVFVCVWLLPLANEIDLFGVKLKREVEDMRRDLSQQITHLKNDIRMSNTATNLLNIWMDPPSKEKIHQLQPKIEAEAQKVQANKAAAPVSLDVSEKVSDLFAMRFNLEMELRRIYSERFPERESPTRVIDLRRELLKQDIISSNVAQGFKDVYSTCNAAIHGRPVEQEQVEFARLSGLQLLRILKQIHPLPED